MHRICKHTPIWSCVDCISLDTFFCWECEEALPKHYYLDITNAFEIKLFFPSYAIPFCECRVEQVICFGTVENCENKRSNFAFSLHWNIRSILQEINFPQSKEFCFSGRVKFSVGRCQSHFLSELFVEVLGFTLRQSQSYEWLTEHYNERSFSCDWLAKEDPTHKHDCQWKIPMSYFLTETEQVRMQGVQVPTVILAIRF